jgi:hypothetical protein
MSKHLVVFAAVLVLSSFSFGQQQQQQDAPDAPKAEIFAGYAYERTNLQNYDPLSTESINGETVQATVYLNRSIGVTADVTCATGTNLAQSGVNIVRYTYLFGPTYAFRISSSVTPFVHVLFGEDHERSSSIFLPDISSNSFSEDFGGGLDVKLVDHVALRLAQVDLMHTNHSGGENHFRYGAGVVFRF